MSGYQINPGQLGYISNFIQSSSPVYTIENPGSIYPKNYTPKICKLSKYSAFPGEEIIIYGKNFNLLNNPLILFNNIPAYNIRVKSSKVISVIFPYNAYDKVVVQYVDKSTQSNIITNFIGFVPENIPFINDVSPYNIKRNDDIIITCQNISNKIKDIDVFFIGTDYKNNFYRISGNPTEINGNCIVFKIEKDFDKLIHFETYIISKGVLGLPENANSNTRFNYIPS